MKKAACIALLAWMGGVFAGTGRAADSLLLELKVYENVEAKRADLRLRLREPVTIAKVEATVDGQPAPVTFAPFGAEGHADTGALLFLIDRSDPKRAKTIEAAKVLTMQLIDRAAPRTDSAVYVFDANLARVADFGTPRGEVAARLQPEKAGGLATELYRSAIEAIAILEKQPVERRALVLLSDGKAEDTTYTVEKVVEAAGKANVVILAVGYAETSQAAVHLQSLRRLAAETGGLFAAADARTRLVPADFLPKVHALLRSGGFAQVDLAENKTAKEVKLTVSFEGRPAVEQVFPLVQLLPPAAKSELPVVTLPAVPDPKVAEVAAKVAEMAKKVEEVAKQVGEVPGKVEESARKAEEAARKAAEEKKAAEKKAEEETKAKELAEKAELAVKLIEMEEQRMRERIAQNTARRKKQAAVIGALAVVLVAGVFVFLRRQRAAEAAAVFARLQVLDGDGTEHLMRKTALRLGRGQDNDLTLANDSVSRHHAEIFRTRDGVFTITELHAGNGVLVNGQPVQKAELHHEDVIELGEVRIRFLIS